jgi:hypothetical protein
MPLAAIISMRLSLVPISPAHRPFANTTPDRLPAANAGISNRKPQSMAGITAHKCTNNNHVHLRIAR